MGVTCTVAIEKNPGIKCIIYIDQDDHGRNVWKRKPFPRGGLLKFPVSSGVWEWSASRILWLFDRQKKPKFSLMLFEVPPEFLFAETFQPLEGPALAEKYKPMTYQMSTQSQFA